MTFDESINIALLEKLSDSELRLWYVRQTINYGWSHNILGLQIDGKAHLRQGKALHNFQTTLPSPDSDMEAQVFKDPYLFDFLGSSNLRREREVEQALVGHIERFLLELGNGFAFIGRQVHLYLSAVDDLLRHPDDEPTIGLLLCRSKNRLVVEYALRDLKKPIGVAQWESKLVRTLPKNLKGILPTVEEFEAELETIESEEKKKRKQ